MQLMVPRFKTAILLITNITWELKLVTDQQT
jgi:hypothetical protein